MTLPERPANINLSGQICPKSRVISNYQGVGALISSQVWGEPLRMCLKRGKISTYQGDLALILIVRLPSFPQKGEKMPVADLILTANNGVPANDLKPLNCHEAALGWVLYARDQSQRNRISRFGTTKNWVTLRSFGERFGTGNLKQLTGLWMARNIYNQGYRRIIPPFSHASFFLGDVLFMGQMNNPHHSMVIVQKDGIRAFARGFNNAGAFGGPYMGWDNTLREITDMNRWDGQNRFMGNNGPYEIYTISYNSIDRNIQNNQNL
jgi:hypothetical protein